MGRIGTEFGLVAPKGKQKIQPAALKKSGRLTDGFLTSAAVSVGTDPKDLIASNTPKSTLTKTTPMNKPLSPATQAVEDAYFNADGFGYRNGLGAALRAAADQADPRKHIEDIDYVHEMYTDGCHDTIATLLSIADDLEANLKGPSRGQ